MPNFKPKVDRDLEQVLEYIKRTRRVEEGKVKFGTDFLHFQHNLLFAFESNPGKDHFIQRCAQEAIFSPKLKGNFSTREYIKLCCNIAKSYLERGKSKFRIAFQISEVPILNFTKRKSSDCSIVSSRKNHSRLVQKISRERDAFAKDLNERFRAIREKTNWFVIITVNTYDVQDAFTLAFDKLDEIRGFANLIINHNTTMTMDHYPRFPINRLRVMPLVTAHTGSGKIIDNPFHYFSDFTPDKQTPFSHFEIDKKIKNLKIAQNRTMKSKMRSEILHSIRRYNRELDESDWKKSLISLWSLLEYITGTQEKESHTKIPQRASQVFSDFREIEMSLEMIRKMRNDIVHRSIEPPAYGHLVWHLKFVCEALIIAMIKNPMRVNFSDFHQMLKSPREANDIRRKIFLLNSKLKYFDP